jgi:hypothetical protein
MRARPILSLTLLLLLFLPLTARAQVERAVPALQLAQVDQAGGVFRYQYRLFGRQTRGELLSDVYLNISTPRREQPPVVLGTSGRFLFDALSEMHRDGAEFSHPPLFVGTPEGWSAAIYIQGVLSWGASRWADGSNLGLPAERELRGFELRSPAVPAFRRYSAVPWRPFPGVDAVERPETVDSTWVVMSGYVVAPGEMEEHLSVDYLRQQLDIACSILLVERCGRYLRPLDQAREAEAARADRTYLLSLALFRRTLAEDASAHAHARLVLGTVAAALERRPPIVRTRERR